ncbi:hypothetical protein ACJRO7_014561 [Eucalyptus globulus]|uniref:Uncharacterized protein n=1 Tax=Eucalyptus globulus TaxID=34317 RepID=A0ABD3L0K9_EUCGL
MEAAPEKQSPSLDDCLKLLRGERDEQPLAGLLLVTKFCKGDDLTSLRRVYDAVGARFLDRLLRTGMGEGSTNGSGNRNAYLQLSAIVFAAFSLGSCIVFLKLFFLDSDYASGSVLES